MIDRSGRLAALAAAFVIALVLAGPPGRAEEAFRIGHLGSGAHQGEAERLEPFRAYLEARLQRPVELVPHRNLQTLVLALTSGGIDYAPLPARGFALGMLACGCLEAIALQPDPQGRTGYHAALAVAAGSRFHSLDDLAGARLVIVGEGSTAAHLVGLAELARIGVERTRFASIGFAPSIEAGAAAVASGEADALLSWSFGDDSGPAGAFARLPEPGALDIVWLSRPIPYGPQVMRADADPMLKAAVADAVTQLSFEAQPEAFEAIDRGTGRPFLRIGTSAYQPVIAALSQFSEAQ